MKKDNPIDPEVGTHLELLIQKMIDEGVVCRVAPEPVYEHLGLRGRDVVGQTPKELHYDPAKVDEFILKEFHESHLDYLKERIASFSSDPSLGSLSEILDCISFGEKVVAAMVKLTDTPRTKFVAYSNSEIRWPFVLPQEYASLKKDISSQLSGEIEVGLLGVAEDLPEQRQERLARLMPMYGLARENGVYLLQSVRDNLDFWKRVKLVTPEEDDSIDKTWGLTPEPDFGTIARQSYLKSLKEDWWGAFLLGFVGCGSPDKFPIENGLGNAALWFVTYKVVLDGYSVADALIEGKSSSRKRRKEIARYAPEVGCDYLNSASSLNGTAYTRTLGFLLDHPDEFVSEDTIARQIFPVIYSSEEPVDEVHRSVVSGIVKEIAVPGSVMVIESVRDDGTKYRFRKS